MQFGVTLPEMMTSGLRLRPLPPRLSALGKGAVLVGGLLLWAGIAQFISVTRLVNPLFVPAPWTLLAVLLDMALARQLELHLAATLQRLALGFASAAILAVGLGLLAGRWAGLRHVIEPIVEVFRPIPPLAMLPLFIVWVGIGETSKVAFITYATFFPMFLTTLEAVLHVDTLLLRAASSLGATPAQLFYRVVLPATLPDVFTGLRLGIALAFFVIVIAEFIGAEHGLGYLINDGRNFFLVPQMLGSAGLLGVLGYTANALLRLLERRCLRWRQYV